MNQQIIGIKQLYTNLREITEKAQEGESYIVVRNSKPVFRIEPMAAVPRHKKYTFEDLKKIRFSSDDPDLSKKVDEIVYGV